MCTFEIQHTCNFTQKNFTDTHFDLFRSLPIYCTISGLFSRSWIRSPKYIGESKIQKKIVGSGNFAFVYRLSFLCECPFFYFVSGFGNALLDVKIIDKYLHTFWLRLDYVVQVEIFTLKLMYKYDSQNFARYSLVLS